MTAAILHGIVLAFGLILPLGPQNTFVLAQGAGQPSLVRALPAVAAAGLCDTLLILVAVFGVSVAVLGVPWLRMGLVAGGVVFLVVVGVLLWRNGAGSAESGATGAFSARRQMAFAASVSLFNPHAILDTVGVIGPSSLAYGETERMAFTLACIGVSWGYFLFLAVLGRVVSNIRGVRGLLNRGSAVIMWGTAVYLASTLL
ncbi:LysE/ArgO family amino acid transporter [Shumkonia mesophila]|uniref:LysE/ArgO family amino acid transporter n=1 Tax=Shumkonia mesophila TaxID=2838854 RepID=UPI0029346DA4|nr:LysE family transporter [Shumkonia mesophila]